jgi:exopolyphosphatase / guanosine-5'-triphosphate,3'-diphosphate pyrophosphatase
MMETVTVARPDRSTSTVQAAIDIGTNSIHLVVARIDDTGRFDILTREKATVRLGHGSGEMSELAPDAIERGIETLRRFRQLADVENARITAVATSAVREATNKDEFISRARQEAGIDVQVISGAEEARLIHLGVLQAVPIYDKHHLVVDIGGGSTEFILAKAGHTEVGRSLKLGAIRLTDRFFPDGVIRPSHVRDCRDYVRAYLAPIAREINELGFEVAVGSSGTINAIAAMAMARRGRDGRSTNNVTFTRQELADIVEVLVTRDPEIDKIPGLDPRRSDIIVAGALLLEQIFEELSIAEMTTSEYALREGVLLDLAHGDDPRAFHHLSDIRREGVQRVVDLFERDRSHVEHATDLALRLFDETQAVHALDTEDRDHLEAAGLMHNVGLFISHSAHHKHSYYVIRNNDHLVGFTDHEVELMALVARYHRKGSPSTKHTEFAHLDSTDQYCVRVLAGLLRIGIALDRAHARHVYDVRCEITRNQISVQPVVRADVDASLEVYTANQRVDLLADSLGRSISIVEPVVSAPSRS